MKISIAIFLFLCISGCNSINTNKINDSDNYKHQIPVDSNYQYFPFESPYLISNDREVDSSIKHLYSGILFQLNEPSFLKTNNIDCIRLIWMNARKPTTVIRMNKMKNTQYFIKKHFENTNRINFSEIIDTIIAIDNDTWETITSGLENSNFWNDKVGNSTDSGKDGILWVLECRLLDRYYFIERWDNGDLSSLKPYPFIKKFFEITGTNTAE